MLGFLLFALEYLPSLMTVLVLLVTYSKTCVKRPLKNRQNIDLNVNW